MARTTSTEMVRTMRELKLFVLRLLAAAFLVAFCMSISRAAASREESDLIERLAESSKGHEDLEMNADVLSYSRPRGVFASTNMNGSAVTGDPRDTNNSFLKTAEKYAGKSTKKD